MTRLFKAQTSINEGKAQGGLRGLAKQGLWAVVGALTFARLFFLPMKQHELPADIRMQPVW